MFSDNLLLEDGILLFLSYRAPLSASRVFFSFLLLSFFFLFPSLSPFFSSLFALSLSFSLFRNNAISISISRDRFADYLFLKPSSKRLNYVRHPDRFNLPENSVNFSLSLSLFFSPLSFTFDILRKRDVTLSRAHYIIHIVLLQT